MNFSKKLNSEGETSLLQTITVAGLIIAAFVIGMLWTKVQTFEKSGGKNNVAANNGGTKVGGTEPNTFPDPTAPKKEIKVQAVEENDHVRGNRQSRIALIEYSDLECPFCKRFHTTAIQMLDKYKDKVMWVYRHFPLDSIHSKARKEAAASECVATLGGEAKFWAFIDKIYEITPGNNGLDPTKLSETAQSLGIDLTAFDTCLAGQEAYQAVSADLESGLSAGITGTPGNLLLDTTTGKVTEIPGAVPLDQLEQSIDQLLSEAQ